FCFSSSRRHTGSKRDWSADVCSSDLGVAEGGVGIVRDRYGCVPVSWGQEEAQFRWDVHGQVGPVHVARMPCLRGWWSGFGVVSGGVGVGEPGARSCRSRFRSAGSWEGGWARWAAVCICSARSGWWVANRCADSSRSLVHPFQVGMMSVKPVRTRRRAMVPTRQKLFQVAVALAGQEAGGAVARQVLGQAGTQQWCAQAGEEESAVVAFGRTCEKKDAVEQDPCAVDLAEASVQFGFQGAQTLVGADPDVQGYGDGGRTFGGLVVEGLSQGPGEAALGAGRVRSQEHTSELQS